MYYLHMSEAIKFVKFNIFRQVSRTSFDGDAVNCKKTNRKEKINKKSFFG